MRPVRLVHLGLGGFFRAHQAWYTGAAPDAEQWGIAAFTGRSTITPVDFVSETDVRKAIENGEKIYITSKTILTPSARDLGNEKDVFASA